MGNILIEPADYLESLPRGSSSISTNDTNFLDPFLFHTDTNELLLGKLKHSWHLFLDESHGGREVYQEFLRKGEWISKITAPINSLPVALGNLHSLTFSPEGKPSALSDLDDDLPKETATTALSLASTSAENKPSSLSGLNPKDHSEKALGQRQAMIDYAFLDPNSQPWLHSIAFPLFLQSDDYKSYVQSCLENSTCDEFLYQGDSERLESLIPAFNPQNRQQVKESLATGLSILDFSDWKRLTLHENWMYQLIAVAEDFHFPVSLASARPDRRGFPLLYVNKAFAQMTKYDRKYVIGKNCKLLHSHETESEETSRISQALSCAHAVKAMVTNQRESGESFVQVLAMKPVFDHQGIYSYVICVHAEVTNYDQTAFNIRPVDDFLALIPATIRANYY